MNMIKGPLFIKCQLKMMQLEKELFTLELSRGTEVKIPPSLDQSKLPISYRYFDPVINIVKSNLEGKNRDFAKLKKSISYAFDQKYHANSIFNLNNKDDDSKKLTTQHKLRRNKDHKFDFINSVHTMQVQDSKYMMIDDDFVTQAENVKKRIENDKANLNKFQKDELLFDALGEIQFKYLKQANLEKDRKKSLNIKLAFSQQMQNLRQKGKRIQVLEMVNSQVCMPILEDRVLEKKPEGEGTGDNCLKKVKARQE